MPVLTVAACAGRGRAVLTAEVGRAAEPRRGGRRGCYRCHCFTRPKINICHITDFPLLVTLQFLLINVWVCRSLNYWVNEPTVGLLIFYGLVSHHHHVSFSLTSHHIFSKRVEETQIKSEAWRCALKDPKHETCLSLVSVPVTTCDMGIVCLRGHNSGISYQTQRTWTSQDPS